MKVSSLFSQLISDDNKAAKLAKNKMPRVTLLPLPAIVRPRFHLPCAGSHLHLSASARPDSSARCPFGYSGRF
jgi:hypothetical protein